MIRFRKRGFQSLTLSIPIWAFAIIYEWRFYRPQIVSGWELNEWDIPPLLEGAQTAAAVLTLVGISLLIVDGMAWLLQRYKSKH